MLPGGIGAISGGQGGVAPDLSSTSGADGGQAGGGGGQIFNFAPPVHVQQQQAFKETITSPLMIVAALGAVWLLTRRK